MDEPTKPPRTKDRKRKKAESAFPYGFKYNTNVINSANDTARVRFANEKETNLESKFNGNSPYPCQNTPIGFERYFRNVPITVEKYPNDNTSEDRVYLKSEDNNEPLVSIVQGLVQSR